MRIIEEELIENLILSHTYYPAYAAGLGLAGHERLLEFGSGGGLLSRELVSILFPEGSLTCIDISKYWMDKARRRLSHFPGIEYRCGDVTVMELPENRFDAIIIHFSLHEVDGQQRIDVLSRLAKTLRPEGTLHIREPARQDHGMEIDEIRNLMRDAGLRTQHAGCTRSWYYGVVCDGIFRKSW